MKRIAWLALFGSAAAVAAVNYDYGSWALIKNNSSISTHTSYEACVRALRRQNPPAPSTSMVYRCQRTITVRNTATASNPTPTPIPTPIPTPTPTPTPTPAPSPGGDLCAGLVTDKTARTLTALARPARGQVFTDPQYGTKIRRITDVAAQFGRQVAKPAYSTVPAWNADESLMVLYIAGKGHILLNGRTYAYIKDLPISPSDIEHFYWDSSDPDLIYYPSGRTLVQYRVSTGAKTTLYTDAASVSFGGDPMYGDWDNRAFGLNSSSGGFVLTLPGRKSPLVSGASRVGPSGYTAIIGRDVYDVPTWTKLRSMQFKLSEHAALTRNSAGDDLWAAVQFDGTVGALVTENLRTGQVRTIIGKATGFPYPGTDTHISGHAFKAPGWVAVSSVGWGDVLLANVDTGKVCRIGKHRSPSGEYWSEPHANISPTGTRVAFGSNWGTSAVDTYVIELPGYR